MAETKTSQRTPQRAGVNREQSRRGTVATPTPGRPAAPLAGGMGAGRGRGGPLSPLSFLRDVRSELRKVVWPTRRETMNLTLVVIALSTAVGLFLGGVDYLFQELFRFLLNLSGNGGA